MREQCKEQSLCESQPVLTRTKLATRGTANSKEHEVQVTATRRGGRVGRACGTAGPRTSPSDARENFPYEKTNEHESNSPRKARRPARGERLRFLQLERRRTDRPGADREWEPARNVDQPPSFRRRSSLSDGSSRSGRIPRGRGTCSRQSQLCVDQLASVVSRPLASRRAKIHCTRLRIALLHSSFDSLAIGTAASSVKHS